MGEAAFAAAPVPSYHSVGDYSVAAPGECTDLKVDAPNRKIYVGSGDSVSILNADTGAVTGTISPTRGVTAILLAPEIGRGFTANGGDNSVTIFDTKSGTVVSTVATTGKKPSALFYDGSVKELFVANQDSGDVTVISTDSGSVVGTVAVGGKLSGIVGNEYGQVYVSAEDQNLLHVISTKTLALVGDDPIAPGVGPRGLGIDPIGRRIFVACTNGVVPVVDSDAGFVFTTMTVGQGASTAVFDRSKEPPPNGEAPWKARILVTATDGTLSLLKMNAFISYSFHDNVKIPEGARSVAFDAKTNRVLVLLPHDISVLGS
jgi:YVTN family beta-propeller protein